MQELTVYNTHSSQLTAHSSQPICVFRYLYTKIISNSSTFHSFQTPDVIEYENTIIWKIRRLARKFLFRFSQCEPVKIYSIQKNDDVLLIAPVKKLMGNKVQIFGSVGANFDFADVLYAEDKPVELLKVAFLKFLHCLKENGFDSLTWNWLDSSSLSRRFLGEIFGDVHFNLVRNVRIPLFIHESFSAYTGSLSKSVRQNIRTAYNRLARDGHTIKAYVFFREELKHGISGDVKKFLRECDDVYINRQSAKYGTKWLGKIHKRFFHYSSKAPYAEEGFVSLIVIDDNVAAFMYGYDNRRIMCIEIPRLAINDTFKFYSPGMLLVNETVKFLIEKGYHYLDLCRGTEKYKFDMGGREYITESGIIDLKLLL